MESIVPRSFWILVEVMLLPALAITGEIRDKWISASESLTLDQYESVEKDFQTAFSTVSDAEAAVTSDTTQGTIDFLYFQKAQLVNAWRSVINSLKGTLDDKDAAENRASQTFGGKSLRDAMRAAKQNVSSESGFQNLFTTVN